MNPTAVRFVFGVVLILFLATSILSAQESNATLSGTVTDSSGKTVPNAVVSVKNLSTGQMETTLSDSAGYYVVYVPAGDYEFSASEATRGVAITRVTLAASSSTFLSPTLKPPQQSPTSPASETLPNAPSSSKPAPSLEDLGFSPAESQANAREQALLDKRTHMLKIHQRMGLITTIPMVASVVTSLGAGGRSTGTASRDLHVALGALTGDLYGITAYYAIRAPRIEGTKTRGPIKAHKILAWIHGPGMLATPILGAMAFSQKNNGERVHGIAQAHGPVAIVTAGAFGAALLTVSVKF